jgi:Uma2 family endonuclease
MRDTARAPRPAVIRNVTEETYYALGEDSPWQLLGGDLVSEPASLWHESRLALLSGLMQAFVGERGGGMAVGGRYPMRLDPRWSPEPDVMWVRQDRRHLMGPQRMEGPADLVIELSGGRPRTDVRRKLPRYRQARVPEIWLIDSFSRSVQVHTLLPGLPAELSVPTSSAAPGDFSFDTDSPADALADSAYQTRTLTAGRLDSAVMSGFWIDVGWLWQEPLPSMLHCYRQIVG